MAANGAEDVIKEIEEAIDMLPIVDSNKEKIYNKNIMNLLKISGVVSNKEYDKLD